MKYSALLLICIITTSCSTKPVHGPQATKNRLFGNWRGIEQSCSGGSPTKQAKRSIEYMKNGDILRTLIVSEDKTSYEINSWKKKNKSGGKCVVKVSEYWQWDNKNIVIWGTQLNAKGSGGYNCDRSHARPEERTHSYSLNGDTLKITLSKAYTVSGRNESPCKNGNAVLVYKRL